MAPLGKKVPEPCSRFSLETKFASFKFLKKTQV